MVNSVKRLYSLVKAVGLCGMMALAVALVSCKEDIELGGEVSFILLDKEDMAVELTADGGELNIYSASEHGPFCLHLASTEPIFTISPSDKLPGAFNIACKSYDDLPEDVQYKFVTEKDLYYSLHKDEIIQGSDEWIAWARCAPYPMVMMSDIKVIVHEDYLNITAPENRTGQSRNLYITFNPNPFCGYFYYNNAIEIHQPSK